jgi:hypothetical protein
MQFENFFLDLFPAKWRLSLIAAYGMFLSCISYFSFARSYLRRRTYIKHCLPGNQTALEEAKKVAVFVHFDRGGNLQKFVEFYLKQLNDCGFAIVFVSNSPTLKQCTIEKLQDICSLIVHRHNVGYDFGAYKEGIAQIPDLDRLDCLLIANDSVYGPLQDLIAMVNQMPASTADVWGVTDSWEFSYHLQSYFLLFHRNALASDAFKGFWRKLHFVQSKVWIVRKYEIGLTRALKRAGLKCQAKFAYRDAASTIAEQIERSGVLQLEYPYRSFLDRLAVALRRKEQAVHEINPVRRFHGQGFSGDKWRHTPEWDALFLGTYDRRNEVPVHKKRSFAEESRTHPVLVPMGGSGSAFQSV